MPRNTARSCKRFQVQDCYLSELHEHIQAAMGWQNCHQFNFEIDGEHFGLPAEEDDEDFFYSDASFASEHFLSDLAPRDGSLWKFTYTYDFGDSWRHDIVLEKTHPPAEGARYPVCVDGAGACPPEDVGGTRGFKDYLVAIADPKNRRHDEFMECYGLFDPAAFDAHAATARMRSGSRSARQ